MDTSKADDVEKKTTVYDRKDELKSTRDDEVAASPVSESEAGPYSKAWTNALVKVRKPVSKAVVFTSDIAAKNPKTSVILGIGVALVLLVIVASGDNSDVVEAVSALEYPDGTPVDEMQIMGNVERDADGKIVSAQTFIINIAIPKVGDKALDVEEKMLDNLLDLQDQWDKDTGNVFRLELFGKRSFDDEFNRGIIIDIPLVPLIFVVMSLFTCFVFYKRDWVYSRCMLGFGAVCSVLFSIIFGYGLLFIIGVPFTSMTQVVPFVMFGIGLDDAFIIWGAYKRTDHSKAPEERIHITMEE
eukprot:scaffold8861_cov98-Cylindrotheca_fusiformis.AAC.1